MTRQQGLQRLIGLAARMSIEPASIKVRPTKDGTRGVRLELMHHGLPISRVCRSQATELDNFRCLVLWLADLVRNIERRIETFEEAFYTAAANSNTTHETYAGFAQNHYSGDATVDLSLGRIESALKRIGLSKADVKLDWNASSGEAKLRLRLRSGAVVAKSSTQQPSWMHNLAALALWLQSRARSYERGLDRRLEDTFASNLLLPR